MFADKIVFGQTVGFDSVWGSLYKNYTDGMLACFEQVNAQGGVAGRKLVVKRLEDKYVPEKTVANVKTLVQDGVFGLVCMGGTGNTIAALPLLEQYRVLSVIGFTLFGIGLDRLAMIRWGIRDIRALIENDVRFLAQFQ